MSNSVWPHLRQPTRLPRPWVVWFLGNTESIETAVEISTDSGDSVDAVPMGVAVVEVGSTVDWCTLLAAADAGNSWLAVAIGSAPVPGGLCLGQDIVDMDFDSIGENKDAVLLTADWDPVTEGLDTIELLVNLDVYRKLVATAEWEVSVAMDSAILVVPVLSEDGDFVIFMELVVGPTKVLLVDRAMAADVDKRSAANVAVSFFKDYGSL